MAKRKAPKRRPAAGRRAAPARRKVTKTARPRKEAAKRPKAAARKARKPARKTSRKTARKVARKTVRKTARKAARKTARRAARTKKPLRKVGRTAAKPARRASTKAARPASPKPKPARAAAGSAPRKRQVAAPVLDRERRRLPDEERLGPQAETPAEDRLIAAARTGHAELRERLRQHTESSPSLFGGDVDAKWEDAYASGEEAPGGSSPTPDQDRVDDIGKALGITYEDNQDLQGGEEVAERDRHRWEYDPASSEDWPHDKKDED